MKDPVLYRRRLIPEECILLKNDRILLNEAGILVTGWQAIRPRKDLHHGFYAADHRLLYYYCDIISHDFDEQKNTLVVTDLLADVIVYPDGFVKVVDIGEMAQALEENLITVPQLKSALHSLNSLLERVYAGDMASLTAPIDRCDFP